jgi:hypothetical protein
VIVLEEGEVVLETAMAWKGSQDLLGGLQSNGGEEKSSMDFS